MTTNFGSFDHAEFDEIDFERNCNNQPTITTLQAKFFAGDFNSAIEASLKVRPLLSVSPTVEMAEYEFYGALARAALWNSATADQRQEHFGALTAHYKQLEVWAEHSPEIFRDRAALAGAEIARIEGRTLDAEQLYEDAIHAAQANGLVQNEALANELAAGFYRTRGLEKVANAYLKDSRSLYARWGADGKVKQLDERYPSLRDERTPASSAAIARPVRQLEAETVVKASQTISSEMVLPSLIENLLRIAVEHAEAERGLLILIRDGEPRMEAEATTGPDGVEVAVRHATITASDLPQSALHFVIRTRESVLLDDASADSDYSKDEYVRQKRARSILCLPIVKQAILVGALYLENNLEPFVFTPDRVAVLQLLASQAAISLENAALYADLQRSETFLAQGQKLSHTGSFGRSALGEKLYWSEETYRIYELDRSIEPTLGWVLQRIHPEDRVRVAQTIENATRERTGFDIEYRLLARDNSVKYLHVVIQVLENAAGELEFAGAVTDITELKKAERNLGLIIDTIPTLSWCNRADGTNEFLSKSWHEYTGLSPEEAHGWGWQVAFHPEDLPPLMKKWGDMLVSGESGEIEARLRRWDGIYRWFLIRAAPFRDESGTILRWYGTSTDIEDRKRGEEALRESEQSFRLVLDGIAGLVAIMSASGEIEVVNRQVLGYFGRTTEQLAGWSTGDEVHPDDLPGVHAAWLHSVETASAYDIDHRLRRADGVYRWFHARGLPLCDSAGRVLRWYVLLTDIDDRKRAEEALRQAQGDLARINRVTTMGELAASLAHEIKQPISGAITNTNTCLRKLGRDEPNLDEVRTIVTKIGRDAQRAAEIIERLRSQFEKGALNRQTVDVNEIIQETIALLLDEAVRYNISVRTKLEADLPRIVGDRVQLQQVAMNLIVNSIEAMKGIEGPREIVIQSQRAEGGQVLVSVSDTGIGLPPQLAEQIFDPFFTTKPHGTGMGLRISRSIIESHRGCLQATANDGPGATFAFSIPYDYSAAFTGERTPAKTPNLKSTDTKVQ